MPSKKDNQLLLIGGLGLGVLFILGRGGRPVFGGSGGFSGFGGFGGGGVGDSVDGLETSGAVDGTQGTPIFDFGLGVPEPTDIPSPIIADPIINNTPPNVGSPVGIRSSGSNANKAYIGTTNRQITAKSAIAHSILTDERNQSPSTGAYQQFTPVVLREVYGVNINPFSRRDPVDQGQNRYTNLPAFIGPTDSAVRAATVPELQARGIGINPYSRNDPVDTQANSNPTARDLLYRAGRQRIRGSATPTDRSNPATGETGSPLNPIPVGATTRPTNPNPPAPTPTQQDTIQELRRRGIGINPFGRSGN